MTVPIHIVQCAGYGGPYRGSFVPMLVAVATEAQRRGHRSTVVFSEVARGRGWLSDFDQIADVHFADTSGSRAMVTRETPRMVRSLLGAQGGEAVVHSHFATFDVPAALVRIGRPRTAVFWHEHGPLYDDPRRRLRNTLRYIVFGRLVAGVLCVSPDVRAALAARRAPVQKLIDFANAVDVERFRPATDAERLAARQALGVDPEARIGLHFGWDWHLKGGDVLLGAGEILRSQREMVLLTVPGRNAPQIVEPDRPGIVQAVPPTDDVKCLYDAADVFISCGRTEGMPLAVLEAMACGLPIVATDLPVQRRLLDGLPGAVVVPADSAAVAEGIQVLASMAPGPRAEHARLGRARISESYGLAGWSRRLVDLYEQALA